MCHWSLFDDFEGAVCCVCSGPLVLLRVELGVLSRGNLRPLEVVSEYIKKNDIEKVSKQEKELLFKLINIFLLILHSDLFLHLFFFFVLDYFSIFSLIVHSYLTSLSRLFLFWSGWTGTVNRMTPSLALLSSSTISSPSH